MPAPWRSCAFCFGVRATGCPLLAAVESRPSMTPGACSTPVRRCSSSTLDSSTRGQPSPNGLHAACWLARHPRRADCGATYAPLSLGATQPIRRRERRLQVLPCLMLPKPCASRRLQRIDDWTWPTLRLLAVGVQHAANEERWPRRPLDRRLPCDRAGRSIDRHELASVTTCGDIDRPIRNKRPIPRPSDLALPHLLA